MSITDVSIFVVGLMAGGLVYALGLFICSPLKKKEERRPLPAIRRERANGTVHELTVEPTITRRTAHLYQANCSPTFIDNNRSVLLGVYDHKTNSFVQEFGDRSIKAAPAVKQLT